MGVILKKWGNSAGLRIPSNVLRSANLKIDDEVDVREENGRVVITPVRREYDLATLVAGITEENRHEIIDFGVPVGKEIW